METPEPECASVKKNETEMVDAVLKQMDQRFGLIYQEDVNDLEEKVEAVRNQGMASTNSLSLELEQARAETFAMRQHAIDHVEVRHAEAMEVLNDDAVAHYTRATETASFLEGKVDEQIAENRAESEELMRKAVLHTEVLHQEHQEAIDQLRMDTSTAQKQLLQLEEASVAAISEVHSYLDEQQADIDLRRTSSHGERINVQRELRRLEALISPKAVASSQRGAGGGAAPASPVGRVITAGGVRLTAVEIANFPSIGD